MTSSPTNPDHNSVSFNLLAEVFKARNDLEEEAACLGAVILNHPILPNLWARLGRAYAKMSTDQMSTDQMSKDNASSDLMSNDQLSIDQLSFAEKSNQEKSTIKPPTDDQQSSEMSNYQLSDIGKSETETSHVKKRRRYFAVASLMRSKLLFRSVERSVTDFVKEKNLDSQRKIETEIESLNLEQTISDKIFELVSKRLKTETAADSEAEPVPAEFEDLGRSVRMKAIEESFRKLDSDVERIDVTSIGLPNLSTFEQKMFSFVDEI
jgi:pentapeptide MXKDX repeat protein